MGVTQLCVRLSTMLRQRLCRRWLWLSRRPSPLWMRSPEHCCSLQTRGRGPGPALSPCPVWLCACWACCTVFSLSAGASFAACSGAVAETCSDTAAADTFWQTFKLPLPAAQRCLVQREHTSRPMIEVVLNDRLGKKVRVKCK